MAPWYRLVPGAACYAAKLIRNLPRFVRGSWVYGLLFLLGVGGACVAWCCHGTSLGLAIGFFPAVVAGTFLSALGRGYRRVSLLERRKADIEALKHFRKMADRLWERCSRTDNIAVRTMQDWWKHSLHPFLSNLDTETRVNTSLKAAKSFLARSKNLAEDIEGVGTEEFLLLYEQLESTFEEAKKKEAAAKEPDEDSRSE